MPRSLSCVCVSAQEEFTVQLWMGNVTSKNAANGEITQAAKQAHPTVLVTPPATRDSFAHVKRSWLAL